MRFTVSTKGFNDIIDITERVEKAVLDSKVKEGICLISSPGSTCGITTLEYESGLIQDLKRVLEKIAPMNKDYEHCKKWPARIGYARPHDSRQRVGRAEGIAGGGDCNGYVHIRSSLLKPFLSVPVEDNKLVLGTWQQIILIDFDNRPREREILVKVI